MLLEMGAEPENACSSVSVNVGRRSVQGPRKLFTAFSSRLEQQHERRPGQEKAYRCRQWHGRE
jgi:hypothetical protein